MRYLRPGLRRQDQSTAPVPITQSAQYRPPLRVLVNGTARARGRLLRCRFWNERWGFLLALAASVPFWYTAITIFIWDRDLGFRQYTFTYKVVVWGIWPVFGIL